MRFVAALDTAIFGVRYTQGAVVDTSEWSRKMVLKYLDSGILAPADTGVLDFSELTLSKLGDVSDTPAVDGQILVRVAGQWTPGDAPPATISDATTTAKGVLKLAGDLGGTADAPTVPALANKETAGTASTLMNNHVAASDPHPQYLTAAEGNAAYDASGAASSAVSAHVAAADPHTQYYNQSRGDARYLRTLGMSGLTDVDLTGLTDGYVLKWVQASGKWKPVAMSGGGATTYAALTDVDVSTAPTDGQVMKWNATASKWKPGTVSAATTGGRYRGAWSTLQVIKSYDLSAGVPADATVSTGTAVISTPAATGTPPADALSVRVGTASDNSSGVAGVLEIPAPAGASQVVFYHAYSTYNGYGGQKFSINGVQKYATTGTSVAWIQDTFTVAPGNPCRWETVAQYGGLYGMANGSIYVTAIQFLGAADPYGLGDAVTYNGVLYVSTIASNSNTPGTANSGWNPVLFGVPTGGTSGQALVKKSGTDNDVTWASTVSTATQVLSPSAVTSSGAYNGVASDAFTATGLNFGAAAPVWLRADMGSPKVVNAYSLQARSGEAANAWAAWDFQGSQDGTTWTTLDSRSGQTPSSTADSSYSCGNVTAYRYYRWNVTASTGGGSNWVTVKLVTLKVSGKANVNVGDLGDAAVSSPAAGDVLVYDSVTGQWKNKPQTVVPRTTYPFSKGGTLAVTTGTQRLYNDTGRTLTLIAVRASAGTAPTGSGLTVDVKKNGTTIFTTTANRPTIAAGANTATAAGIDVTSWAAGDYLTVDITAVGSSTAGADLTVQVVAEG